ncbi:MAG: DUF2971 domain-containing protein [Pseudomonadota bacterium]
METFFEEEDRAVPPKYLYHYTNLGGTIGILTSRSIWATDCLAMNDSREATEVLRVLEHTIENQFFRIGVKDQGWFHSLAIELRKVQALRGSCIVSFSEHSDDLAQWRAYGGNGAGVAIGILNSALSDLSNRVGFRLGKVIYDFEHQRRICWRFTRWLFEKYGITERIDEFPAAMLKEIGDFVNSDGLLMKHDSFKSEAEWRIVRNVPDLYDVEWEYRASDNMIAPYTVIPAEQDVFCEQPFGGDLTYQLVLGPTCRRNPTSSCLQALNKKITGHGIGQTLSASPYIT